jgi:L-amino acid N-acyltransferase YncA
MMSPGWTLKRLHALGDAHIEQLADVLIECVEGGASVSFMLPLARERALQFWRKVAIGVAAGERALLVAEDLQGICGTVQLILDLPENQPTRADLAKMLVAHRARKQGLGTALMRAAESLARDCGKTLLVLDAVTNGDGARLYERLGWVRVGDIPGFALLPTGEPCSATYFYRNLASEPEPKKHLVAARPARTAVPESIQVIRCDESFAESILVILNDAIVNSTAIYDYQPRPLESMTPWFTAKRKGNYPVLGAVSEAGELLGFASYGPFRAWPAYKYSVEHSVYVSPSHRGKGIGKQLVEAVIQEATKHDYHVLIGGIDSQNAASIALHKGLGFQHAGTMRQVGYKFERWLDLEFYELILKTPACPVGE